MRDRPEPLRVSVLNNPLEYLIFAEPCCVFLADKALDLIARQNLANDVEHLVSAEIQPNLAEPIEQFRKYPTLRKC